MIEESAPLSDDQDKLENIDEIELIIDYLNGHLDPERHEAVRKRLDEDEAFRIFAAPLLLTWSVPKHIERHPLPEGELERDWTEFKRRVGIEHLPGWELPKPRPEQ
jgi:hypothetical protein